MTERRWWSLRPFFGPHAEEPCYRLVSLGFQEVVAVRFLPAASGSHTLDPSRFRIETALSDGLAARDPKRWLDEYSRIWSETGLSPRPGFYEATSTSSWLSSLVHSRRGRHFVVVAELAYAEILASEVDVVVGAAVTWNE